MQRDIGRLAHMIEAAEAIGSVEAINQMKHADRPELVTVPVHGKQDLGPGLAAKILRDAGLK